MTRKWMCATAGVIAGMLAAPAASTAAPPGVVVMPVGGEAIGATVVQQPNGGLLVGAAVEPRGRARFGVARLTPAGRLDRRFGTRGATTVLVGKEQAMHDLTSVLLLPDGRILLGGNVDLGSEQIGDQPGVTSAAGAAYGFARLLANGRIDTSFGGGDGVHTVHAPGGLIPYLNFMLARGGDVLFGGVGGTAGGDYGCVLGGTGELNAPAAGWNDACFRPARVSSGDFGDAALDAAGNVVVAGRGQRDADPSEDRRDWRDVLMLSRVARDGTPDLAFGGQGVELGPEPDGKFPRALLARRAGGWVVAVSVGNALQLAGFTDQGALDPAFGSGGLVRVDADPRAVPEAISDLVAMPDGGVLAVGTTEGRDRSTMLVRLTANGRPHARFGPGGRVVLRRRQLGYFSESTGDALVQRGGRVVVVGTGWDAQARKRLVTVMRFTSRGKLDPSFGSRPRRR